MSKQNRRRIGIIGAGVAGMSAAWDLVNAGHEVVIFESETRVGGLAAGFKEPEWDWSLEKYYHHWFETDSDLLKLASEMNVRDRILFPRPKTSYWINGKIYRSEISLSALQLPLSLIGKLRLGLAGVFLKLTPFWQPLEKVTADQWMRRYMGQEVYEKLWKPLLIGKFSDRYDKVNMAWMWARIKARSLRLGIYEGGFQAFLDELAQQLQNKGVEIKLKTPITSISSDGSKIIVQTEADIDTEFDQVLSTTSPGLMLRLVDGLDTSEYGSKVGSLQSIGAICVILALEKSLLTDGTYWLNLPANSPDKSKTKFPFLALVEHTNWMDKANYGDNVLVYCGDYVPSDHEYFTLSDEKLCKRFTSVLPQFNENFSQEWIKDYWVFRSKYAQPVPGISHSEKIPDIETPIKGLYWASMSQVYPWDRGTNFAVEIGRRAASIMLNDSR